MDQKKGLLWAELVHRFVSWKMEDWLVFNPSGTLGQTQNCTSGWTSANLQNTHLTLLHHSFMRGQGRCPYFTEEEVAQNSKTQCTKASQLISHGAKKDSQASSSSHGSDSVLGGDTVRSFFLCLLLCMLLWVTSAVWNKQEINIQSQCS